MTGFILVILFSLIFVGIIKRTKSIASGRKGPGVMQPLKDIWVLLHKGSVYSKTTSLVFRVAPVIWLTVTLASALLIPFFNHGSLVSFDGDFIFFAYLIGFGKLFMILAALDTGSSFEGMGANREALYSLFIEPAFFILMGAFGMLTGYTSFEEIFSYPLFTDNYSYMIGILAIYILIQIAMIENSRLPVDDPKTHLELTMVHEVMILDYSGFDLALIHFATGLRFAIYGLLIANFIVPGYFPGYYQFALFAGVQFLFAVIVGILESFRARNKMIKNPQFMFTLMGISLLIFVLVLLITNKILI